MKLFILFSENAMDSDESPNKRKCPDHNQTAILEREIEKQNKEFFELRGKLKANTKKEDRIAILTFNQQFIPEGNSEVAENFLFDKALSFFM